MEIWDLYDKNLNLTGETIQRGATLPPDRFHLVVHFWIKNNAGEYLIQKRSDKVEINKGMWSFTGGSALSGENSKQAVIREVQEEIGLTLMSDEIKIIHQYCRRDYWAHVYLLEKGVPLVDFYPGDEVDTVKYVSKTEILNLKENGLFWNLDDLYFEKLFFH